MKKISILTGTSKPTICGLPLRMDTYTTCGFGCEYCFANNRSPSDKSEKAAVFKCKEFRVGDLGELERVLQKAADPNYVTNRYVIEMLRRNLTIHAGGMSDPFQPCEAEYHVTKDAIDILNKYNKRILFSTKSDNLYGANIRPDLHSFQLSVTNTSNRKDIEPGVANIEDRIKLYKELKKEGFKVGIRIQPFIPEVSTIDILECFKDADQITIEGFKIVPAYCERQREYNEFLKKKYIEGYDLKRIGLFNLMPEDRIMMYAPFIKYLEENNIPFSISDNDLRYISTNKCCCGDRLIERSTGLDSTAMIKDYGLNYTIDDIYNAAKNSYVGDITGVTAVSSLTHSKHIRDYLKKNNIEYSIDLHTIGTLIDSYREPRCDSSRCAFSSKYQFVPEEGTEQYSVVEKYIKEAEKK